MDKNSFTSLKNLMQTSQTSPPRLVTYGSLAPGRPNHHELAGLSGKWIEGYVKGHLHAEGWGATLGYPGIILDDTGPRVDVFVFESADLEAHWARLDAFEGDAYKRSVTCVQTAKGPIEAQIYTLAKSRI